MEIKSLIGYVIWKIIVCNPFSLWYKNPHLERVAPPRLCPYTIVRPHDCAAHDCAQTRLFPDTIMPIHVCAHTRLCPDTFVTSRVFTQTRLCLTWSCPVAFLPKHDCALHGRAHSTVSRHVCAQTRLYPDMFLPRHDCAHTRTCPFDCAQTRLSSHTIEQRHNFFLSG